MWKKIYVGNVYRTIFSHPYLVLLRFGVLLYLHPFTFLFLVY